MDQSSENKIDTPNAHAQACGETGNCRRYGVMQVLKFLAALAMLVSFFLPLSSCRGMNEASAPTPLAQDSALSTFEVADNGRLLRPFERANFARAGGWVMLMGLCGPFVAWAGLWFGRGHLIRALARIFEMSAVFLSVIVLAVVVSFSEHMLYGGYVAGAALLSYVFGLICEYAGMLSRHTQRQCDPPGKPLDI